MTSVGKILRQAREHQGREIAEIAEELCLTQGYLRAIEQDDLHLLPGTFFYKSFVRQYAALLGVDTKLIETGMSAVVAALEPAPVIGQTPQPAEAPIRVLDPIVRDTNRYYFLESGIGVSSAVLAGVLLVCSGFYAWWTRAPQVASPSQTAGQPAAQAQPSPPTANVQTHTTVATAVSATNSPGELPRLDVSTDPDGTNHIELHLSATEKTWLSITSEGKQIFSGFLEPSESKTVRSSDAARMKVGNAGGLEVQWNGKTIGPLGPRGTVRTVVFTPDNFQILDPASTL